ncbi:MAG: type I-E CRISPR-associated protein Cse2/CasB [Anaerolineae bacterium]|nr:type I-E CRISPR-associated protein Cse2/CasB [Anaerolineae bacterium]
MSDYEPNPQVKQFLERLRTLRPGDRAQLKRSAGMSLSEATQVIGLFYRLLPLGVAVYNEPHYFLIATLFPLTDEGGQGNFGIALRHIRPKTKSSERNPLDRRVEILLDADATQFPFRLRQALRLLKSKDVKVNWQSLAEDILNWGHPNRFVQKNWAKAYFAHFE